jgi:UDP-galactopyranose mutase
MNDDQIVFGGRLGKYQYYNMDQVVASALTQSEKF